MPSYEYRAVDKKKSCAFCKDSFIQHESIPQERLKQCPRCGNPVRIVFSPPLIAEKGLNPEKKLLSDKNLAHHGFTKLVKEKKGQYRKVT